MISAGVDVVSHTTGSVIFFPTANKFLWVSLVFRMQLIYLLGVQGDILRIELT